MSLLYHLQVVNASVDARQHLSPLLGGFWTWVQSRPEPEEEAKNVRLTTTTNWNINLKNNNSWNVGLPFADFFHPVLQLVSLEEDDEDGLVDPVSLWRHRTLSKSVANENNNKIRCVCSDRGGVLQGLLDICLSQEHVPPADPPQHPLEGGDSFPADDSSHKPER